MRCWALCKWPGRHSPAETWSLLENKGLRMVFLKVFFPIAEEDKLIPGQYEVWPRPVG